MSRILNHIHDYSFNALRDIQEVVDGLAVDVTDMLETGIVRDSGESLDNNGIEDPHSILGLVRDNFAAIDAQRAIKKYGRKSDSKVSKVSADATDVGAPAPTNVD